MQSAHGGGTESRNIVSDKDDTSGGPGSAATLRFKTFRLRSVLAVPQSCRVRPGGHRPAAPGSGSRSPATTRAGTRGQPHARAREMWGEDSANADLIFVTFRCGDSSRFVTIRTLHLEHLAPSFPSRPTSTSTLFKSHRLLGRRAAQRPPGRGVLPSRGALTGPRGRPRRCRGRKGS